MAPQHRISHQKRREKDEMDLKERLLLAVGTFLLSGKTFVFLQKEIYVSLFVCGMFCYYHFPLKIQKSNSNFQREFFIFIASFPMIMFSSILRFASKNASLGRNNLSLHDEFCRPS